MGFFADLVLGGIGVFVFFMFVWLIISSVSRTLANLKQIESDTQIQKARVYADNKEAINKQHGLFNMALEKLANADGGESSELMEAIQMFTMMKNGGAVGDASTDGAQPPISWDLIRGQLSNPEVKALIMEHKDEALKILQS